MSVLLKLKNLDFPRVGAKPRTKARPIIGITTRGKFSGSVLLHISDEKTV